MQHRTAETKTSEKTNIDAEAKYFLVLLSPSHVGEVHGVGAPNEDVDGDGKATNVALRFLGQMYDASSQLSYNYFRDYNSDTGRYVESDPIGLNGGNNTYGYVGGNPLKYIDSMGLEAGVTIWQSVGWGESSFGHVSGEVNGTTYSFGPGGMTVMPTIDYVAKNAFRDGQEVLIKLSPEQETSLAQCLSQARDIYNIATNNCGTPVQECLKNMGIDTGNQKMPVSLGEKLIDMPIFNGTKEYPASTPANGSSAPWAR